MGTEDLGSASLLLPFPSPGELLLFDSLDGAFPELRRRGDGDRDDDLEWREREEEFPEKWERLRLLERLRGVRERERPLLGLWCSWDCCCSRCPPCQLLER